MHFLILMLTFFLFLSLHRNLKDFHSSLSFRHCHYSYVLKVLLGINL